MKGFLSEIRQECGDLASVLQLLQLSDVVTNCSSVPIVTIVRRING